MITKIKTTTKKKTTSKMKTTTKMKTTSKIKMTSQKKDNIKNKDDLKMKTTLKIPNPPKPQAFMKRTCTMPNYTQRLTYSALSIFATRISGPYEPFELRGAYSLRSHDFMLHWKARNQPYRFFLGQTDIHSGFLEVDVCPLYDLNRRC